MNDNEWSALLTRANGYDLVKHQEIMDTMRNMPGYKNWFQSLPEIVQTAHNNIMPFDKFYTDKETGQFVYRLYCVDDDGIHYYGTLALMNQTNFVTVHRDDLCKLDEWKEIHLKKIGDAIWVVGAYWSSIWIFIGTSTRKFFVVIKFLYKKIYC